MIILYVLSLLSHPWPVLAELQNADLITSKECKKLSDLSDVVEAQWGKSPEVKVKSAAVLRRHEFEKESQVLAGRQWGPSSVCL